jgi:hypothetical protein
MSIISIDLSGPECVETLANRLDIDALPNRGAVGNLAVFSSSSYKFFDGTACPAYIVPSLMTE